MALPPGFYAPRPDGLFDMSTPQGAFPTALNEQQLQGAGLQLYDQTAIAPPPVPDLRTAQAAPFAVPNLPPPQADAPPPPPTGAPENAVPPPSIDASGWKMDPNMQALVTPGGVPGPTKVLIKAAPGAPGAAPQQAGAGVDPRVRQIDEATQAYQQRLLKGSGRGRVVPEHQQETTGKVERKVGPSPEAMEAVSDAEINYQLWAQEKAEAQAAGMEQASYRGAGEAEQQRYQMQMDSYRRQLIDQDIADRQQAISEREQRIAQMASQPQSYFQSHGALAGAAVVIGAALGAAGASMAHTPNFAGEIMNNSMEQEYRAQESAIAHAKNGTEADRWSLNEFVKAHGDPHTAELEFKLRGKDLIAKMAEVEALRSGSPGIMAAFNDWKAQRDLERAKEIAALDASIRGEVEQNWKTIPRQTTGGGMDPLTAMKRAAQFRTAAETAYGVLPADKQAELDVKREAAGAKGGGAARETFIPGEGYAYSATEGPKLRAAKVGVTRLNEIADQALDIRKQLGEGKIGIPEAVGRLSSLSGQGAVAYKNAEQMGALDAGTQQVWASIFGAPDEFLSLKGATANARIRQFKEGVNSGWNAVREAQITTEPPKGGAGPSDADAANPPKPRSWEPDK